METIPSSLNSSQDKTYNLRESTREYMHRHAISEPVEDINESLISREPAIIKAFPLQRTYPSLRALSALIKDFMKNPTNCPELYQKILAREKISNAFIATTFAPKIENYSANTLASNLAKFSEIIYWNLVKGDPNGVPMKIFAECFNLFIRERCPNEPGLEISDVKLHSNNNAKSELAPKEIIEAKLVESANKAENDATDTIVASTIPNYAPKDIIRETNETDVQTVTKEDVGKTERRTTKRKTIYLRDDTQIIEISICSVITNINKNVASAASSEKCKLINKKRQLADEDIMSTQKTQKSNDVI